MSKLRFLIAVAAASTLSSADLNGRWTGAIETNGGRVPVYLTVVQRDGKIAGAIATGADTKQIPIENAAFDADKLSFQVRDNVGRVVAFRLSLAGAALSGESTVGGQTSKVLLSRKTVTVDGSVIEIGTGGGGGGSRSASGEGAGTGGGVAPGQTVREGVYRVGGGVSAPVLIYKTEPEYTEEARAAKYQGTVLLYVEIDPNGSATNVKVQRSLGLGLDEKAVEAVTKWKFKPGQKDGVAVTVQATIEINFRL